MRTSSEILISVLDAIGTIMLHAASSICREMRRLASLRAIVMAFILSEFLGSCCGLIGNLGSTANKRKVCTSKLVPIESLRVLI